MSEDQATATIDRRREARLRQKAKSQGFALCKDRARTWNIDHQGGYMIVNVYDNTVAAGGRYDLTLEDVERFLAEG